MSLIGELISTVFERRYRSALPGQSDGRPVEELAVDLLGNHGEVSGGTLRH